MKKKCKEQKCKLVNYDSLPDYLKDNEFILGYYRCEWPLKPTIFSIFSIHNETLNIWTHLIGFFIFLALTVLSAMMIHRNEVEKSVPSTESVLLPSIWKLPQLLMNCLPKGLYHANSHTYSCISMAMKDDVTKMISPLIAKPTTRWPFFTFMSGAMFSLLSSSICHLISCHSERMTYAMLRLDYTGISALIVASFYLIVYYSFTCDPFLCNLYIGFITTFGLATVLISLVPVFQTTRFRMVRVFLFVSMSSSGLVPIVHKLVAFGNQPEAIQSACYEFLMLVFYGLGLMVYVMRIPERWMPGKFDLVGHSHQLFHVFVIAGAYTHYLAGLVYR